MEPIHIVTDIAIVLLVGSLVSWFATKIKLPDVLLLLVAGLVMGLFSVAGEQVIGFPTTFLSAISIIALALIVFESTAQIKLRELDSFSVKVFNLVLVGVSLHLIIFGAAAWYLVGLSWWNALILAALIAGTSPDVVLSLLGSSKQKVVELLKLESIFNTPLTVIIPFVIVDMMRGLSGTVAQGFFDQFVPFLTKFVSGIGAGVVVGLILLKVMKKARKTTYGYLAVIVAVFLTYVLAENLGGSGVLAVTTLGMFFGNSTFKEKRKLLIFEGLLAKALYVFVFVALGLVIKLPITRDFLLYSITLYLIYLVVRFMSIRIATKSVDVSLREGIFSTLNAPKGVATATVVFAFYIYTDASSASFIPGIETALLYALAITLYSIIIAAITSYFSKYFIGVKLDK